MRSTSARATAVVGGKTVQALLFAFSGEGVGIAEQANYIEQLSKPRVKHEVIGKELARIGALEASVIFSEVITSLAEGSVDDEESSESSDDDGDEAEGK